MIAVEVTARELRNRIARHVRYRGETLVQRPGGRWVIVGSDGAATTKALRLPDPAAMLSLVRPWEKYGD